MKKHAKTFLVLAVAFTLVFAAWGAVRIVNAVNFDLNCKAYLKRAADANTVEMAIVELERAIAYADQNKLTDGIVSIFLKNPANDIGFWYNNIKAAHAELESLPPDAAPLEKTNVLMKLRESLTDRNDGNTDVNHPEGISVYPRNTPYFWWCLISAAGLCAFWILFGIAVDTKFPVRTKKRQ